MPRGWLDPLLKTHLFGSRSASLGNQLPTFHFPQGIGYTRFHHRLGEQGMGRDFPIFFDDNDVLDFIKETDDTQILVNLLNSICNSGNTILLEKIIKKRKIKPLLKDNRFDGFDRAASNADFQTLTLLKNIGYKASKETDKYSLIKAFEHGSLDYLKLLVDEGYDYKEKNFNEQLFSMLREQLSANEDELLAVVRYLVEELALECKFYNLPDVEVSIAPLAYSVTRNRPLVAEFFLAKGCDINGIGLVISDRKFTYLEASVRKNFIDMVEMLLRRGATCTDNENWALRFALSHGYTQISNVLLESGADPMAVSQEEIENIFEPELKELILNLQSSINLKNKLSNQLAEKEPVKRKKRDF
jgi:hypothetical protein